MAVCYPALAWERLGKPSTVNDAIFATWGGLRGAVSMALALALVSSTENGDTTISVDDSHRVFFCVGGVAALTLLINATTSGFVLDKLRLLDVTNTLETRIMFHYVKKRIRLKVGFGKKIICQKGGYAWRKKRKEKRSYECIG